MINDKKRGGGEGNVTHENLISQKAASNSYNFLLIIHQRL